MNETTSKGAATKSGAVTPTERMLADFCERSFLKLWSYPNPYKDDGHELCDLLAVFGDYIFIFFDRENALPEVPDKEPQVLWDRWKRNAIDRQVKTAHGADRYIRRGRLPSWVLKGRTHESGTQKFGGGGTGRGGIRDIVMRRVGHGSDWLDDRAERLRPE